jgi:hypothetical protein
VGDVTSPEKAANATEAVGGLARASMTRKFDFIAALGQEFCEVLSPPVLSDLIVPQDGFEVWRRAFGTDPSPAALAELTDADIKRLLAVCIAYFECPSLSETHVRLAVSRTLARWPI